MMAFSVFNDFDYNKRSFFVLYKFHFCLMVSFLCNLHRQSHCILRATRYRSTHYHSLPNSQLGSSLQPEVNRENVCMSIHTQSFLSMAIGAPQCLTRMQLRIYVLIRMLVRLTHVNEENLWYLIVNALCWHLALCTATTYFSCGSAIKICSIYTLYFLVSICKLTSSESMP